MIRIESVNNYIEKYYKPVNHQMALLREEGEREHVPIILRETEMFLGTILPLIKPKKIFEIGAAIGYSALFFSYLMPDSSVLSVERDDEMWVRAKANIVANSKKKNIFVAHSDAVEFLEMLQEDGDWKTEPFDLVFIDAAKSHYREFFDLALPLTKEGSVIICDNILMKGMTAEEEINKKHKTSIKNMRDFVNYICDIPNAETSILSIGDGISITKINRRIDE